MTRLLINNIFLLNLFILCGYGSDHFSLSPYGRPDTMHIETMCTKHQCPYVIPENPKTSPHVEYFYSFNNELLLKKILNEFRDISQSRSYLSAMPSIINNLPPLAYCLTILSTVVCVLSLLCLIMFLLPCNCFSKFFTFILFKPIKKQPLRRRSHFFVFLCAIFIVFFEIILPSVQLASMVNANRHINSGVTQLYCNLFNGIKGIATGTHALSCPVAQQTSFLGVNLLCDIVVDKALFVEVNSAVDKLQDIAYKGMNEVADTGLNFTKNLKLLNEIAKSHDQMIIQSEFIAPHLDDIEKFINKKDDLYDKLKKTLKNQKEILEQHYVATENLFKQIRRDFQRYIHAFLSDAATIKLYLEIAVWIAYAYAALFIFTISFGAYVHLVYFLTWLKKKNATAFIKSSTAFLCISYGSLAILSSLGLCISVIIFSYSSTSCYVAREVFVEQGRWDEYFSIFNSSYLNKFTPVLNKCITQQVDIETLVAAPEPLSKLIDNLKNDVFTNVDKLTVDYVSLDLNKAPTAFKTLPLIVLPTTTRLLQSEAKLLRTGLQVEDLNLSCEYISPDLEKYCNEASITIFGLRSLQNDFNQLWKTNHCLTSKLCEEDSTKTLFKKEDFKNELKTNVKDIVNDKDNMLYAVALKVDLLNTAIELNGNGSKEVVNNIADAVSSDQMNLFHLGTILLSEVATIVTESKDLITRFLAESSALKFLRFSLPDRSLCILLHQFAQNTLRIGCDNVLAETATDVLSFIMLTTSSFVLMIFSMISYCYWKHLMKFQVI